jgi:hypothetical protein
LREMSLTGRQNTGPAKLFSHLKTNIKAASKPTAYTRLTESAEWKVSCTADAPPFHRPGNKQRKAEIARTTEEENLVRSVY